jgi:hypothetical protein
MDEILLLTRAFAFAAEKHAHQRRKGENAEPYVNHLAEVAHLLAVAVHGRDANLIAAGLLHDTLEDTEATWDELAATFNEDIAELVSEVTDDKSLPKQVRKRLQVEHAPDKTDRAKMLTRPRTCAASSPVRRPAGRWSVGWNMSAGAAMWPPACAGCIPGWKPSSTRPPQRRIVRWPASDAIRPEAARPACPSTCSRKSLPSSRPCCCARASAMSGGC